MNNTLHGIPTEQEIEEAAKAICKEWGYEWEGDPEDDDQVAPEEDYYDDPTPSKPLYRRAAKAALLAVKNMKQEEKAMNDKQVFKTYYKDIFDYSTKLTASNPNGEWETVNIRIDDGEEEPQILMLPNKVALDLARWILEQVEEK